MLGPATAAAKRSGVEPVAIAVAPNGGRRTKSDHPAIPLSPAEIAATAVSCMEAGASLIHVHVRDRDGAHLLDADAYRSAISAIHGAVGDRLIVQITSEALGVYGAHQQIEVVKQVRPEAVSLALRELAPAEADEPAFGAFLAWLRQEKIVPQIILYSPEEAVRLAGMAARGLLPYDEIPVLYVLGRYAKEQKSQPADLLAFLAPGMARFANWMVCAFGERETACVTAGALFGGDARVGFENNLFLPNGGTAADNAGLVDAARSAVERCGLPVSSADRLREKWSRGL